MVCHFVFHWSGMVCVVNEKAAQSKRMRVNPTKPSRLMEPGLSATIAAPTQGL